MIFEKELWSKKPIASATLVYHKRLSQAPAPALSTNLVEGLRQTGAIVDVVVSQPSANAQAGGEAPAAQTVRGLIDTGASISTIDDSVAMQLGLTQTGSVELGGVGGSSQRPIYAAKFVVPEFGVELDPIEVAGVSIPFADVQILIGRDFLKQLRLDYKGSEGTFALTQTGDVSTPATSSAASGSAGSAVAPGDMVVPVVVGAGILAAIVGGLFLVDVL